MLSERDIAWIKNNRKETTKNRTLSITLLGEKEGGKHPITGEPISKPKEEVVDARVTEITSAFKTDISLEGGIKVEKGDLWVVIGLDELEELAHDEFHTIIYDESPYTVLAADREGIGEHNRVTVVARLES